MMEMEDVRCLRADVSGPRTESGKGQGRDTRMCGDPKMWFPMRVTYQREMKVKAELDRLGIENFVPMRYKVVESQNDGDMELRRARILPFPSQTLALLSRQLLTTVETAFPRTQRIL